jgi:AcrR family transcriptional regulator
VFDNARMHIAAEKNDRRISRTRQALHESLIALILEKHYDEITVQDIIDRANVGRSTFYTHYRDKEDLFRTGWERLLRGIAGHIDLTTEGAEKPLPIEWFFLHLKEEANRFYRALVRSQMADRLFTYGIYYLAKCLEEDHADLPPEKFSTNVPLPVLANFISLQIFGLLKWWLDNEMPYSPKEMSEMFFKLVMPGVWPATMERGHPARN